MPSSSFPLLRLPLVALREIIEKIEPYEQYQLSFCSKRTHFVIKTYRRKSPLSLKLFSLRGDIKINLLEEKFSSDCVQLSFKVRDSSKQIRITKFLVDYLCDLFTARVEKVEANSKTDKIWMLDIVEERQGAFSYDAQVLNFGYGHNDEQLRHIFLDLNPKSLDIHQPASKQFRIDNFHKKYEKLIISPATWMTGENLCQLDCVELEIYRYISSTEINRFLKHVLRGGAPRLREFSAEIQVANADVILDGIQELLTGSEQGEDEDGDWTLKGTVAREGGFVLVSIRFSALGIINMEIKGV